MCHENKMGAAKEQHPYINQVDIVGGTEGGTGGTVTRPLFTEDINCIHTVPTRQSWLSS